MSVPNQPNRQWVLVARILRPRGNKGEVVAELLTDFPQRFATLNQIYLRQNEEPARLAGLQKFWLDQNGMGVFHFAGFASISQAETLRGTEVLLPIEERVKLPAGQYFVTDLIGCTVFEQPAGAAKLASPPCAMEIAPRVLGTVQDVFFTGESVAGTPLLQVETPAGEMLIPLAQDICVGIDVAARRIDVKLPEGWDELSASG